MHRPLRLKAAKEREQATTSPLNLPRSSFAAAVAAKNWRGTGETGETSETSETLLERITSSGQDQLVGRELHVHGVYI